MHGMAWFQTKTYLDPEFKKLPKAHTELAEEILGPAELTSSAVVEFFLNGVCF